jgi:ribosomal protein L37AE/L43A
MIARPGYCPECGSPRVADLDAGEGRWVCDECGHVMPAPATLPPVPNYADERAPSPPVTLKPRPRYL